MTRGSKLSRRSRNKDNTGPELGEVEREENEWEKDKDQPSASEQLEKYKPEKDEPADDKKGGLTSKQKATIATVGKVAEGLQKAIPASFTAGMSGYSGSGGQILSQGGATTDSALLGDANVAYEQKKKELGLT